MAVKKAKRGVLADTLHKLIEERHPHGMPLGTAATVLYGSDIKIHRERIYRLAGALRKNNIMVYSFGGRYHLCNDDGIRLTEVAVQKQILAGSILQNAFLLREKAIEAGLPDEQRKRLDKAFGELKRVVANLF
jgi:hypothetical protein